MFCHSINALEFASNFHPKSIRCDPRKYGLLGDPIDPKECGLIQVDRVTPKVDHNDPNVDHRGSQVEVDCVSLGYKSKGTKL